MNTQLIQMSQSGRLQEHTPCNHGNTCNTCNTLWEERQRNVGVSLCPLIHTEERKGRKRRKEERKEGKEARKVGNEERRVGNERMKPGKRGRTYNTKLLLPHLGSYCTL